LKLLFEKCSPLELFGDDMFESNGTFEEGFLLAVKYGHLEVVKHLIKVDLSTLSPGLRPRVDVSTGMDIAFEYGHMDIVKLMIKKGVYASKSEMLEAFKYKRMDIVKLMIEKGTEFPVLSPKNFNKFVKSVPDDELVPFCNLPNLTPELKLALEPRIVEYHIKLNKIIHEMQEILSQKVDEQNLTSIIAEYLQIFSSDSS